MDLDYTNSQSCLSLVLLRSAKQFIAMSTGTGQCDCDTITNYPIRLTLHNTAFFSRLNFTVVTHNLHHVTQAERGKCVFYFVIFDQ